MESYTIPNQARDVFQWSENFLVVALEDSWLLFPKIWMDDAYMYKYWDPGSSTDPKLRFGCVLIWCLGFGWLWYRDGFDLDSTWFAG